MNASRTMRTRKSAVGSPKTRRGFTLIEALAAITIMAIVLPALMYGVSLAAQLATTTRQRILATTLGQAKLNELLATGDWQNGALSGDFADQAPGMTWKADVNQWSDPNLQNQNLEEIDLTVSWTLNNQPRDVQLSTMVYAPAGTDGSSLP